MIVQGVLKGIHGIDRHVANDILESGITCNWFRSHPVVALRDVPALLTERNLYWHQNRYEDPDPDASGEKFGDHSPFISTTAGTAEIDHDAGVVNVFHARDSALEFATNFWSGNGFVFSCYVFVLGRRAVEHQPFGEEVRDLHVYTRYSQFHHEGEITAKILIPPPQIEKWEFYEIDEAMAALANNTYPIPQATGHNDARFVKPRLVSNLREPL